MIAGNAEMSQLHEITRPQFAIILWWLCNYKIITGIKKALHNYTLRLQQDG